MAKNTPRVQICTPSAKVHWGQNCAHEHSILLYTRISAKLWQAFFEKLKLILYYNYNESQNKLIPFDILSAVNWRALLLFLTECSQWFIKSAL